MCYFIFLLSILVPPIGIIGGLLGMSFNFKHWKIYAFCIALGFASIAYCYFPKGDPDIVRYVAYINSLKGSSLASALEHGFRGEANTKLFSFFCWIAAKMGDPQLIPAISTFSVYFCGLYITCQTAKEMKIERRTIIAYILFILLTLNLYSVINNVRNVLAFALVSCAVFRDLYQKKRDLATVLLYIIPLFIHPTAIVLIGVRFIIRISSKMKVVMMAAIIFLQAIIHEIYSVVINIGLSFPLFTALRLFVIKAESYFSDTSSEWGLLTQNSIVFRTERIANTFFAVVIGLLALYISKKVKKGEIPLKEKEQLFLEYTFILCLLTISCWVMLSPQYWRFFSVSVLACAIVYFVVAKYCSRRARYMSKMIFLVTPIQLAICLYRIAYSDLSALLLKPFISSPIIVLLNAL